MTCPHDFITTSRAPVKIQPVSPALNAVAFTARRVFGFIPPSQIHQSSQRLVCGCTLLRDICGLLGPSCTAPSMPIQSRPSREGAASLPQMVSDLITSPIFWKLERGRGRVCDVGAGWPPPCVYIWSDMRQEQSKNEEPRSAQVHGPETTVNLLCPSPPLVSCQ